MNISFQVPPGVKIEDSLKLQVTEIYFGQKQNGEDLYVNYTKEVKDNFSVTGDTIYLSPTIKNIAAKHADEVLVYPILN